MIISQLSALSILDSRGFPTIEASVVLENGMHVSASVPSGASKGVREAIELRDGGKSYQGMGVHKAVHHINSLIQSAFVGSNLPSIQEADALLCQLDGSIQKAHLGSNAILVVSYAILKAHASLNHLPVYRYLNPKSCQLPMLMVNLINGGMHADNSLCIQELMIVPVRFHSFSEALNAGLHVFYALKDILKKRQYPTNVGDEGGFAPNMNEEEAMQTLVEAISMAGYRPGVDIFLALDVASSSFYKEGCYHFHQHRFSSQAWVDYMYQWVKKYPIASIEDGMAEMDDEGWRYCTQKMGSQIQLVGDDSFVSQRHWLSHGIQNQLANAILIKPNQVGTVTETLDCIDLARQNNYAYIVSHRSGETEETIIADFAVATHASQVKFGSFCRADRTSKYNQLLRIEKELNHQAIYAGVDLRFPYINT